MAWDCGNLKGSCAQLPGFCERERNEPLVDELIYGEDAVSLFIKNRVLEYNLGRERLPVSRRRACLPATCSILSRASGFLDFMRIAYDSHTSLESCLVNQGGWFTPRTSFRWGDSDKLETTVTS